MSGEDDEWPPEDLSYSLSAPRKYDRTAPAEWSAFDLTVETLLRLLEPGDRILWEDRKAPLEVQSLDHRAGTYIADGYWEDGATWEVEGQRGGTYCVANWMHRNDQDGPERKSVAHTAYPQVYRTTDGSWESEGKLGHVVVVGDGYWHPNPADIGHAAPAPGFKADDPVGTVVFDQPGYDRLRWGEYDGFEFGEPVVAVDTAEGVVPVAVAPDWVIAFRTTEAVA